MPQQNRRPIGGDHPAGGEPVAPVVLIGFMGSGKSSIGRRLAQRLGTAFVDSDDQIEAVTGRPIAAIFGEEGETAFRAIEHATITRLLDPPRCRVLALGGGAAMHPGTRVSLRDLAIVVHLRVSLGEALRRIGDDPARPMLARLDLAELHAARMAVYDDLADLVVDVDEPGPDDVTALITQRLAELDRASGSASET